MADADEDMIPSLSSSAHHSSADPSADIEDEAQDFRFLASLTAKSSSTSNLPRRGEKDFEPNPTQAQSNTLAASREAMHNALSVERVFLPRNPLVGQYLPDSKDWRWDTLPVEVGGSGKGGRCVVVEKFRTTYAKNVGVADYRNWAWLLPEEALFLLERGTIDIRWPDDSVKAFMKGDTASYGGENKDNDGDGQLGLGEKDLREGAQNEEDEIRGRDEDISTEVPNPHHTPLQVGEVPMSLQAAYASFIGKSGLTLEKYNVYSGLRRLGYIVQRAPTWDDGEDEMEQRANGHASEPNGHVIQPPQAMSSHFSSDTQTGATALINRLIAYLWTPKPVQYCPSHGPLIYPGLYRNYNDIFRALTLIPCHPTASTATITQTPTPQPTPPFSICWYVHKPSPNQQFRKSKPPPPDFRIAVLDARTTSMPTATEIGTLLDSMPEDQLPKDKRMEARLKHGVRNVILAVVDCGLVSYLRLSDMCSSTQGRVIDTKGVRGAKRGGGWKRGGAGGGRGRGGKR